MKTTAKHDEKMANLVFSDIYPLYLNSVEKKGRTQEELHQVINWLTGFNDKTINEMLEKKVTFRDFFAHAEVNPHAALISGTICGYRIEDIDNKLTRHIRYLDKLVNELTKGKAMEKILPEKSEGSDVVNTTSNKIE